MTGNPHSTAKVNTFQAIVRSPIESRPVSITQAEYEVIQQLRSLLEKGRHHQFMIAFRDGKISVYHVNLHTTLTVVK